MKKNGRMKMKNKKQRTEAEIKVIKKMKFKPV